MNEWSGKTLRLATEGDYLDRLHDVYPNKDAERDVDGDILRSVRESFEARDDMTLLNKLLDLDKFPIKDSYVSFLRKDRNALARNPRTVRRICDRLYEMEIDDVLAGATAPKESNRMRGSQFTNWMRNNFRHVSIDLFRASTTGVVMLMASEIVARDFCNAELNFGISKRPDMVAKSGSRYVVGEAKFLSSAGGNQDRGFENGMLLLNNHSGRAYKVFLLDGAPWVERGSAQFGRIEHGASPIFSTLLLEEYLNSIR